jgi:putative ABC transport system permease protein
MNLWQDLRFAFRLLIKGRWFTLAAVVALALGIGANVTVFTIVNAVLLRDLPFEKPEQIVIFGTQDAQGRPNGISLPDFQDWKASARSFSGMAFVVGFPCNVSDEDHAPEQYLGVYSSVDIFRMLNQHAVVGRDFRPDDDRPGAEPVAMLANTIWHKRYGDNPAILGKVVRLQGISATVIGVMPAGMQFPFNADLWMPEAQWLPGAPDRNRSVHTWTAVGRLKDGVTIKQAQAEMATIGAKLARDYPKEDKALTPIVDTFTRRILGPQIRILFWSLMGAVVFVLLIACANVANLLLARAADRSREIGIRFSLGATRSQVVRQLLVESVLLAFVGGIVGFGLSIFGIRAFDAVTRNVGIPYWMVFSLDARVFTFFTIACLATGIIFGLAPALHISRTNLNDVLKEGGRTGSSGSRARRWTGALIIFELALTLVLLAGAGFMMRSFLVMYSTDIGIDTSHLLTMRMQVPGRKYVSVEDRAIFFQRVNESLAANGGIVAGATTTSLPMGGTGQVQLTIDGRPAAGGTQLPMVDLIGIGPRYFDAVGAPLVRGRIFEASDGLPGHENAIVNQRFVSMFFPGEDAIGRRLKLTQVQANALDALGKSWVTIVAISPTIRQQGFGPSGPTNATEPDPVVYVPYRLNPVRGMAIIVRTRSAPGSAAPLMREEMRKLDSDMALFQVNTMDEVLAINRWFLRTFGSMFAIFAFIALVLSAVGLYAITAYSVTQRTQEIGIRMALGAEPRHVQWLFVRRGLIQLAIGLIIGMAGAFGTGRLLQSQLVRTSPTDPPTLVTIAAILIAVGLAACFFPARRATRLNPVVALRHE